VNHKAWDYLIVTASNEDQASAYRTQLDLRKGLGFIPGVRKVLAVSDPEGKRVGSGGSTISCLLKVLSRELAGDPKRLRDHEAWQEALRGLRILIIHAGGDSRRMPAYGPCGKIFIPLPGEPDRALGVTLLDRQLPTYLGLPAAPPGQGQVVVTTGDVLLTFDPGRVKFAGEGITGLGCYAGPDTAKDHGVFCTDADGNVRRFLQKPSPADQAEKKAIHRHGQTILDIGVMNLAARSAVKIIQTCETRLSSSGELIWTGAFSEAVERSGLDFYREICCALGSETDFPEYLRSVRGAGSALEEQHLRHIFEALAGLPFSVCLLARCGFFHFGTSRQLIRSGTALMNLDLGTPHSTSFLSMNNDVSGDGQIAGRNSWVEGCRVSSTLALGGENVVTGADLDGAPLALPEKSVLDILKGKSRTGRSVWFVRCYGLDDVFHKSRDEGARLANLPLGDWIRLVGAEESHIWDKETPPEAKLVWNGRFFPSSAGPQGFRDWLWMLGPATATSAQKKRWLEAERYSFAEMAGLASQEEFHRRRLETRAEEFRRSLPRIFRPQSGFSAGELSFLFANLGSEKRRGWLADTLRESWLHFGGEEFVPGPEQLEFSRILHTLGSAISMRIAAGDGTFSTLVAEGYAGLPDPAVAWLAGQGLTRDLAKDAGLWARMAREAAFENISRTIVLSREKLPGYPRNALRTDEIIWGRAPARLDLGGGWTDTPPYSLEHGGCVINAAVNLNGQPPIHAYARVIETPEIRISSIDHGARITISDLDELLDYRKPTSRFGLAKATLALSGFSPEHGDWPPGTATLEDMLGSFGGGIELTTLAAIPSGSGLGTSSIMGAVLMAVVHRMIGRSLTPRQLFHNVLRLEQQLTTGGGWQDQVGGAVASVKMITTEPGMIPDPRLQYVPPDVLEPRSNGGQTLLYYTGIRRLAKDILHHVVGSYLDRDRAALETLRRLHAFPPLMVEAMAGKDLERFGELVDAAWNLNKRIDPDSSTEVIEDILAGIRPHVFGAKLLGAGGGGFLLIVCRSPQDAGAVRRLLLENPPNDRARFFDYEISQTGLAVTVC
jgi:fucokinase